MIAIIDDGGRQYRVEKGAFLFVDRKELEAGETIEFEKVLLVENGADIQVGQPTIPGAKVTAKVIGETKAPKVIFHRFRKRKGSRSRAGHRQPYTQVQIESITV